MENTLFLELCDKFSNPESLPQLPSAALRLTRLIDEGDCTTAELERVILGDPGLTAGILRATSSAAFGLGKPVTTVKGAILMVGQRMLRSIATTMWVQTMLAEGKGKSQFDVNAFAKHSIFVGFLSRYLFSVRQKQNRVPSRFEPDELFAAGVLHDLGVGLLAISEPALFDRVLLESRMRQIPFEESFERIAEGSLSELAATAAKTWKFPIVFKDIIQFHGCPLKHETESVPIACVHYANYLANQHGVTMFEGDNWACDPEVLELVGLPEKDIPELLELVEHHTSSYVVGAA